MPGEKHNLAGIAGVVVGLLANLGVVGVNIPFLLIRTDRPIRPMIWPFFYLLAAAFALGAGMPFARQALRARNRIGLLGVLLCLSPLPVGILTFWLFAKMHGLQVEE